MNNHQPPQVSIGMPVYNGDRFLQQAIEAILAQTFTDFELIISDNASTDKTQEICQFYAQSDRRIRYYRQEKNLGAGWNQSQVVRLSTGKYFKWAHHDDIFAPQLIEKCALALDNNPTVVVCYPQTIIIDGEGKHVEKYVDNFNLRSPKPHERFRQYHHLIRYGHRCHPFHGMMRTDVLQSTPLVGSYPSSDLVLVGELVLRGEVYEVPEPLFFKRDHPETSVRAYRTYRERIAWYDPAKKGQLHLTKWKWFFEYLSAIGRVQLSLRDRLLCYLQMAQWLLWNWLYLAKDLLKTATWPLLQPILNFELPKKVTNKSQL